MLKHWAQSWLLGVPVRLALVLFDIKQTIEVGFRDDAGILKSQRTFETEKIPGLYAKQLKVSLTS